MNPLAAARAYQAIQGAGSVNPGGAAGPTDAPGFSDLVESFVRFPAQGTGGVWELGRKTLGKGCAALGTGP